MHLIYTTELSWIINIMPEHTDPSVPSWHRFKNSVRMKSGSCIRSYWRTAISCSSLLWKVSRWGKCIKVFENCVENWLSLSGISELRLTRAVMTPNLIFRTYRRVSIKHYSHYRHYRHCTTHYTHCATHYCATHYTHIVPHITKIAPHITHIAPHITHTAPHYTHCATHYRHCATHASLCNL